LRAEKRSEEQIPGNSTAGGGRGERREERGERREERGERREERY